MSRGLDAMEPEERRDLLKNIVDEITVDQDNNIDITIAIPMESDVQIAQHASPSPCTSASSPHLAP